MSERGTAETTTSLVQRAEEADRTERPFFSSHPHVRSAFLSAIAEKLLSEKMERLRTTAKPVGSGNNCPLINFVKP